MAAEVPSCPERQAAGPSTHGSTPTSTQVLISTSIFPALRSRRATALGSKVCQRFAPWKSEEGLALLFCSLLASTVVDWMVHLKHRLINPCLIGWLFWFCCIFKQINRINAQLHLNTSWLSNKIQTSWLLLIF